jgi:HD-like signal output (HDOD) protein
MTSNKDLESRILGSLDGLPSLPGVAMQLMEMALSDEASIQKISEVVEMDPAIAARVLKVANSPLYGQPNRVSSIRRAIVVLGLNPLRELVLAVSVIQTLKGATRKDKETLIFPSPDFWRHSLAVGWCARAICGHIRFPDPDKGFLVGLLHDIGLIAMNLQLGARYAGPLKTFLSQPQDRLSFHKFEREEFGVDHARVGKILLSHWNFPDSLSGPIEHHHDDDPVALADSDTTKLSQVLALADNYVSHQGFTLDNRLDPPFLDERLVRQVGIAPRDLGRLAQGLVKAINNMAALLEVDIPEIEDFVDRLQQANSILSQRALELEMEVKRLSLLNEITQNCYSSLDIKSAVRNTTESLSHLLGVNLVSLTLFDRTPPTMSLSLVKSTLKKDLQAAIRHAIKEAETIWGQPLNPSSVQLEIGNKDLVADSADGAEEMCFLDVPVKNKDRMMGVLSIAVSGENRYGERDEEILRKIAGIMAAHVDLVRRHAAAGVISPPEV